MTATEHWRRFPARTWLLFLAAGTLLLVIACRQAHSPASGTKTPPEVARLVDEAAHRREAGDLPGAQAALAEALRLHPDDPKALVLLGRLQLLDLSDPDAGLATY